MTIKALILATLQDSGPADISLLRGTMYAAGGLDLVFQTCIALYSLIRECKVSVSCGIYSAV